MKGKSMKISINQVKNEEGFVLVIALVILVFITIIGISATTTTDIELQIASNEKTRKIVLYAADAGIEFGRAWLNDKKVEDIGYWDKLLQMGENIESWGVPVKILDDEIDESFRNVDLARFTLQVMDNNDLDEDTQADTDNTIILISTGFLQNKPEVQTQIQTIVRYLGGGDQYAQDHYDSESSGRASREGASVADNLRW
ncbi:MAG: pilus assembly PilX N-terminal domain-containing protein [Desulfobacteraceae bacterium]|nr:pilus assembly PilX N-terminal domain-containing protein [Desulfobacteraceae bacterium]